MATEKEIAELSVARDAIVDSLRKLQLMESASSMIISQATEAGYVSGWYDAAMTAVESLEAKGHIAAANIVRRVADLGDMPKA